MEVVRLIRKGKEAHLHFARKDKSVNVLDESCIEQLERHLAALEKDAPDVLVLESGMPGCFIAGADIDVIRDVKNAEEAERLAERGQALCRRIEDLAAVSVVVVDGACMGGGLEIAMGCDYIIAVHGEKTRLALPEIKIGIHPGFGGCVRLPKRVGWMTAVDMILTGHPVDAKKARRSRLADIACHAEEVDAGIAYLAGKGKAERKGTRPWWLRLWPIKVLFFQQVNKRALSRFSHLDIEDAYPAIPATIRLLREIIGMSDGLAYAREAESLGHLAVTPTCKSLIRVFRLGEALKNQPAVRQGKAVAASVNHVAVFGAGAMGSGIAWVAARQSGVDMHDVSDTSLSRGMQALSRLAQRDAKRMQQIRPVMDKSGLKRQQVVIEAVLEDIRVKNKLWVEVEQGVAKDALLLTNTSSLSVSDMQAVCKHPGRMAGMHFFNPAPKMPLVEVVAGEKTTKKTIKAVCALAARWGKYPVIVADRPGFLVNRCLMPYMSAAFSLLTRGQSPAHVDGVLKNFGMPMGAFELADRVGLDICHHVGEKLSGAFGEHQAMPDWFDAMVNDGLLGEKSGKGFFIYEKGKRGDQNPDLGSYIKTLPSGEEKGSAADIGTAQEVMTDAEVVNACLLPMLLEALKCLSEAVVEDAAQLDAAMVYGIGFPPYRGGLLHYYSGQSAETLRAQLKALDMAEPENLGVLYG